MDEHDRTYAKAAERGDKDAAFGALYRAQREVVNSMRTMKIGDVAGGFIAKGGIADITQIRDAFAKDEHGRPVDLSKETPYSMAGIREVDRELLGPMPTPAELDEYARNPRIVDLVNHIKRTGEVVPLITVVHGMRDAASEGSVASVLHGSRDRLAALDLMGAKSFPGVVVQDLTFPLNVRDASGNLMPPSARFPLPAKQKAKTHVSMQNESASLRADKKLSAPDLPELPAAPQPARVPAAPVAPFY